MMNVDVCMYVYVCMNVYVPSPSTYHSVAYKMLTNLMVELT